MREILMMRGARILVETCAGLQPGERAVIVTDAERDVTIATLLAAAVLERGGEPVVCVMPPRPLDGMEPAAPVAAAMARRTSC